MGLMLFAVSLGAFADNANEGKKKSNAVTETLVLGSTSSYDISIDMVENEIREITIPVEAGYRPYNQLVFVEGDPGCVQWSMTRDLVIRLVAQYRGRVILRVRLLTIDAPGIEKTVNLIINIDKFIGKQ